VDGFAFRYYTRELEESQRMNLLLANCNVRTKYHILAAKTEVELLKKSDFGLPF